MMSDEPGAAAGPDPGPAGLALPTAPQQGPLDPGLVAATARLAEEAGLSAVWALDHLFWATPVLDPLAVLAHLVPRTQLLLGTGVLQLPLRDVPVVAKAAATLQLLSGGRLLLGVGIGEHQDEYGAAGRDFAGRAGALDDGVARLRDLWAEVDDDERYAQRPVPSPAIPLWFAGRTRKALQRVAREGDGWAPMLLSPGQLRRRAAWLDEELEAVGRPPEAVRRAVTVWVAVGEDRRRDGLDWLGTFFSRPGHQFARRLVSGPPAACIEQLAAYHEAGAGHVVVQLTADDPRPMLDELASSGWLGPGTPSPT